MAFSDITPERLAQAAVTTSLATIYTVPAFKRAMLKSIHVVNTTGAARSLDLYVVPSGGFAGTDNAILYQTSIAGRSILQSDAVLVMYAGETIQAEASAAGLTVTISGGEAV